MLALRQARRADRATVDPGGPDRDKKLAIEPRIARESRPLADVVLQNRHIALSFANEYTLAAELESDLYTELYAQQRG